LDDPKARGDIEALLEHELDGGVRSKAHEVLAELGKAGVSGIKQAKHETQKLKREVDDLKLRIHKLEQLVHGDSKSPSKSKGSAKAAHKKGPARAKAKRSEKVSAKKTRTHKRR